MTNEVQVTMCRCLGLCDDGPVMIVYPEGVWYQKVKEKEEDVSEVVSSHLRSGRVVSRRVSNDPQAMKTAATEHRAHYRALVKARDTFFRTILNEMIQAFMPSRGLLTAIGMDVFTAVADGASAEHLAQRVRAGPRARNGLPHPANLWHRWSTLTECAPEPRPKLRVEETTGSQPSLQPVTPAG